MMRKTKLLLTLILTLLLTSPLNAQHTFQVARVVDGDTIIVNIFGKKERVRLIGVDTPETKHPKKPVEYYGEDAYQFTKRLCEGERVRLEYDPNNKYLKHRDKYGRLLAYVFLTDGTFG
ncbi:MAG: thermonuclease family protein [Pseudomonadota bacterium]